MSGTLRAVAVTVLLVWLVVDGFVVFRRRPGEAARSDRLSILAIVIASWIGIGGAIYLGFHGIGVPSEHVVPLQLIGFGLLAIGIVTRSTAIAQLGKFHTPIVAVQTGHRVVDTGLYRRVRHPSYLGALIAYAGFGLALGSWWSMACILGTAIVAYSYRIHVEEQALAASLGEAYVAYRARTHRLIPGIY